MSKLISYVLLVLFLHLSLNESQKVWAADDYQTLDIQVQGKGIAMVEARLELPVPSDVVFTVLTDFANWPDLFPYEIEIQIEKFPDGLVISEMKIPNKIFSWTTRLKIKSRVTSPYRLETNLIEGDFHQYKQVWQLTPLKEGKYTRAELHLILQPKGWIMELIPEFLYRWVLRGDLEAHFEKLRHQAGVRHGAEFREAL